MLVILTWCLLNINAITNKMENCVQWLKFMIYQLKVYLKIRDSQLMSVIFRCEHNRKRKNFIIRPLCSCIMRVLGVKICYEQKLNIHAKQFSLCYLEPFYSTRKSHASLKECSECVLRLLKLDTLSELTYIEIGQLWKVEEMTSSYGNYCNYFMPLSRLIPRSYGRKVLTVI